MAKKALIEYALYTRQSCRAFGISETSYRHEANLSDDNAKITDWLLRLTAWQRVRSLGTCVTYSIGKNLLWSRCGYNTNVAILHNLSS